MGPIQKELQALLTKEFNPRHLEVINESELHAGHAHMGPETHFRLRILSAKFNGKKTIERHRLVHDALAELLKEKIHAVTYELYAEGESFASRAK